MDEWRRLGVFIEGANLAIFWYFQGVEKVCIGNEWVKTYLRDRLFMLAIRFDISNISKILKINY